ncbi:putative cation transport protein chaC-related [Pseudorhizobium banfieldiae]|uniref:glutathione-specific gamma-glutamylcyclotransferase n=1 Tax=Pseudorhizobium banfieldiae TaxID=1125847 RepID=L0NK10_9HYPH|nr:gamma-glutamylcyclotransferase [Pseudorhizobium banfieldiae]CAD6618796.1 gamma-glutamylcyclotransferase [arsenite-oxidising bacterium NT-25]CCF21151.1 putative cation transport protein chaC-related [Pseudorhizobium banfieldiae]
MAPDMDEFWVFGYGSLMWNPGFPFEEKAEAHIFGYRRSLCVRSHVHRGTPERPGLVLGLDRGGSCRGMAFRVRSEERAEVLAYLRARELVTHVYKERFLPAMLGDRRQVRALGYVVDRQHAQYAGVLDAREAAEIVRSAVGKSGPNPAYVLNTVSHLREMGIRDHWLEGVSRIVDVD